MASRVEVVLASGNAHKHRELNALLASNTDMAQRLAIDLSQDMASVKLLVPVKGKVTGKQNAYHKRG